MTIQVSFNGQTYDIPESTETGWADLTDYLVALSNAATTQGMTFASRIATTTPQNIAGTDCVVVMNIASASSAVLPVGVTGQFYGIYDGSGAAQTNNITISTSSSQTIKGALTYVIANPYGGVLLQFDGVEWIVIAERSNRTVLSLANAASGTVSFAGMNAITFELGVATSGEGLLCTSSYLSGVVSAPSDPNGIFLTADSGTGLYITKSASSTTISIKNRLGSTKTLLVRGLYG